LAAHVHRRLAGGSAHHEGLRTAVNSALPPGHGSTKLCQRLAT
jgi:hypothetical protein